MIHGMYVPLSKFLLLWYSHIWKIFHCFVIEICNFSFNSAKDAPQEEVLLLIYIHHSEISLLKRCGDKIVLQIWTCFLDTKFSHRRSYISGPVKNRGTNVKFFCIWNSCVKCFPAWEIHFFNSYTKIPHVISWELYSHYAFLCGQTVPLLITNC